MDFINMNFINYALQEYKILQRVKRNIKRWSDRKKAFPVIMGLNPTYRCNLKCKFCGVHLSGITKQKKDILTLEDITYFIEECKSVGVQKIIIAGDGEPFCRSDLKLIIKKIKEEGMSCNIITNGTLINREIAKFLVDLHVEGIVFSVHGPEKIHDNLTGVAGSFKRVDKAIGNIKKFKKFRYLPHLYTNTVITNENTVYIAELLKIFRTWDIRTYRLADLVVDQPRVKKLALSVDGEKGERVNPPEISLSKKRNPYCLLPFYYPALRADGTLNVCCNRQDSKENIKQGLKKIWLGKYFSSAREEMFEGFNDKCKLCNARVSDELRRI